jgi:hypothetical protein
MHNVHALPIASASASAPTLASSAMLVELNISCWEGRKADKKAAELVTDTYGAKKGRFNTSKYLIECNELDAIKTMVNAIRSYFRHSTLPWNKSGANLITNLQYFDFHKEITGMIQHFDQLVEDFLSVYEWKVQEAQVDLGPRFILNEYPSISELRRRFRVTLTYMPVPERGDFRVDLPEEAKQVLADSYQKFMDEQIVNIQHDLWNRLIKPVKHMSNMLDYGPNSKPSGFRDTLVSNVEDILQILKNCNVTNDPEMERVRQELSAILRNVTPEALREDTHLRLQTKSRVDSVIRSIPELPSLDM